MALVLIWWEDHKLARESLRVALTERRRIEGYGPQSKADLVWKAVEGVQRGVSHEMIRLCDRCRPPFALFVSILISTRTYWGNGNKELGKENSQNDKLPRILRVVDVRASLDVEKNEQLHPLVIFSESTVFPRCLR